MGHGRSTEPPLSYRNLNQTTPAPGLQKGPSAVQNQQSSTDNGHSVQNHTPSSGRNAASSAHTGSRRSAKAKSIPSHSLSPVSAKKNQKK